MDASVSSLARPAVRRWDCVADYAAEAKRRIRRVDASTAEATIAAAEVKWLGTGSRGQ